MTEDNHCWNIMFGLRPRVHNSNSRPAFSSPATVPGMKTLADIEAEMMFGPPRPQGPPQGGGQQPQLVDRGGHVGHINPALHNLNYPGMRDRQQQPPPSQQQQQRQQQQQQPPPFHQHQQFRHSPGLTNQQQLQQGENILMSRKI